MKQLTDYILEKFKISSKTLSDQRFNPDKLNNDKQILYNSEDQDEEGDNDIFLDDFEKEVEQIDKKFDYYISTRFVSLGNSKNLEKDLYSYCPGDNNTLYDMIQNIMTGKDLGYEVRLVGGHIEVDCINSGSRGTYYIYALSHEAYDEVSAWFEGGDEEVKSLDFLFKEENILEIEL